MAEMYCPRCGKTASSHLATHCCCAGDSLTELVSRPLAYAHKTTISCSVCGGDHPTYNQQGELCALLPGGGVFNSKDSKEINRVK